MASAAEINQQLPETLPEDFNEWDSEPSPHALPVNARDLERPRGLGDVPQPPAPRYGREITPARGVDGLHGAALSSPAKSDTDGAILRQSASVTPMPARNAAPATRAEEASRPIHEPLLSPQPPKVPVPDVLGNAIRIPASAPSSVDEIVNALRPKFAAAPVEKPTAKKWMIIAAAGVSLIVVLVILAIWLFSPAKPSITAKSVAPAVHPTEAQLVSNTPKPSPSTPLTQHQPSAASQTQQAVASQPTTGNDQDVPPDVQSKEMDEQLAAPKRIPSDIKKPVVKDDAPPPGFSASGIEGLGGSNSVGSVFNGARPVVKPAPGPVKISAGIAGGLLIQKTPPVYPAIAKSARVSGTVIIQATISKAGSVKDARVLSGPAMLRQAALAAVQTWRYKPYMLDNAPTEVETTVNVTFSLGN
jgi:TonB family protein